MEDLQKKNKIARRLTVIFGWILSVAAFAAGGLVVLAVSGKYNLERKNISFEPKAQETMQTVMTVSETGKREDKEDADLQGKFYEYNEDILTFLIMGIEQESDGKQAGALFLLALNPREQTMTLIPIDHSTMTAVAVYDEQGDYQDTVTAQIGVQYGFGDGGKESCKYQVKAVQNLFGGIPIHGYVAVDMDVIPELIALAGSVEPEILEGVGDDGREERLTRQTQTLIAYIERVKQLTKKDLTIPVRIYNKISQKTVTDITVDEVTYLTAMAGGYHFDEGQIVTIPGRGISGEKNQNGRYDEFYVDKRALNELVFDVFYETRED